MFVIAKDKFTLMHGVTFHCISVFIRCQFKSTNMVKSTNLPQNLSIATWQIHCVVMKASITLSFFIGKDIQSMSASFMQDFNLILEKEHHLLSTVKHADLFGYFTLRFVEYI